MAKRNKKYRVVVNETESVEYEVEAKDEMSAKVLAVDYADGVEIRRDYIKGSCEFVSIEEVNNAKV